MKTQNAIALAAGSLLLATAISGFSAGHVARRGAKSGKAVTIVWYASPITDTGLRMALINAFEKTYPNIHVKLDTAPTNTDTMRSTLATAITGGSSHPDVYMGDVIWPAQFGHNDLALPLSKYLPKSFFSRFAPGLVKGASYQGSVYGAPFFMDSGFLYYRKDLLAKENLPVPKTWTQLVNDSKILQKDKLVKYGYVWQGADYEGLTCDWMEVMTDAGGTVFNKNYSKVTIDSAASLRALKFLRSLITSGISPAAETTFEEPQAMNVFDAGNAAFLRNWDYAWSNSNDPKDSKVVGKVGVVPMPTFPGQKSPGYSCIGGWDIYVNPHSTHRAQDLTFIKWITGVKAQTILATQFSEIPTNYAVQQNPAVQAVNPVLKTVHNVHLIARPSGSPAYPQISHAIYSNLNAALAGTVSPASALKSAAQQIQLAISKHSL